jgi:hypothetical protein
MDKKQEQLVLKIYTYARQKLLFKVVGGLFNLLLILFIAWLSLAIADNTFYFSTITRFGFWIINFIIIIYIVNKYLIVNIRELIQLKNRKNLTSIALEIGQNFPETKDELANSYNLMVKEKDENISSGLVHAAIMRTMESLQDVDFSELIRFRNYLPKPTLYIPIILAIIVTLGFKSGDIFHSSKRLLNPFNNYLKIPAFVFEVTPGNTTVIKGNKLDINVKYSGPAITAAKIIFSDKKIASINLNRDDNEFSVLIPSLKKSVDYQIKGVPLNVRKFGDRIISSIYHIDVLIPPMIEKFDITISPPPYTSLPIEYLNRNIGDITTLSGSIVKIKLNADKVLKRAEIRYGSGRTIPLNVKGLSAQGSFRVLEDDHYKILLYDINDQCNIRPIEYRIQTIADNIPFVDIFQPGEDVEVALDVKLPLKIKAEDDFGITKGFLVYQILHTDTMDIEKAKKIRLTLQAGQKTRQEISYLWDFNELPLAFGERIKYFAEIYDNNNINGPGVGKSKIFYIRFPSVDDLFNAFSKNEQENSEEMKDVKAQSKDLKKKLEEIERELKKSKKLDWQTKKKIEQSIEQQKALQQKVEKVQKDIEKMVEKLEKNNLISKELLEKYMKLQEMFKNIATPELLEAMQQLQNQMDKKNNNPREMQKAMEKFKLNQEAFKENIDRTMELLKQVQFEQQMDRLVQKAKKLTKQQQKISEKLKNKALKETDRKNLENMQKQQRDNLNSLERDMQGLMDNPRLQKYNETSKILADIDRELQQNTMQKSSQNIENDIKSSKNNSAQKKSSNLQKEFQKMQQKMRDAQKKMGEKSKADVKKDMLLVMKKLLQLSKEQEKVLRQTKNSSDYSIEQRELAEKQSDVLANFHNTTSDIVKLSKKTFFMDKNISKALSDAEKGMQQSLSGLTERGQGSQAARYQQKAMAGLNSSFMKMQGSMGKLSKSSSGTGFEEFMQQLQQMADGQGQINEQSLNLMPGEQGKEGEGLPSQQQMAQRLAQQQRALQQALKEMTDKMGDRKDMLGRIGDAAGDMEEVIQDLIKNKVDRKTIDRQRQILSRLLDAQKSAQQREYSKKRKSQAAKKYNSNDPGSIKNQYDMEKKHLEDALNRALKEGYNDDYKKLIEGYFKALEKDE